MHPNGKWLLSRANYQKSSVWDYEKGERISRFVGHKALIVGSAMSPDSGRVLTASSDGVIGIWELATGRSLALLSMIDALRNKLQVVRFYPDGNAGGGYLQLADGSVRHLRPMLGLDRLVNAILDAQTRCLRG